ncbi:MAG: hypothetical protein LBB50_01745, partial [Oscillospiraceae bacterium]|nr:hypothetical protein [Oscillospiraceae bacterium]
MTENKDLWNAIANEYDARMNDDGNDFHIKLIRPATVRLLNPKKGERDIPMPEPVKTALQDHKLTSKRYQ